MNLLRKTARNKSGDILLRESVCVFFVVCFCFLFFSSLFFVLFVCLFFLLSVELSRSYISEVCSGRFTRTNLPQVHSCLCETEET